LNDNKTTWTVLVPVSLLCFSAAVRLFFLFFVSGTGYTGWYQDSFHHWQIAYYTLHVGLEQNPPRMWDLSGVEYFWGLLPTFVEMTLLWVFSTASLLPFRLFNVLMGSISAVLLYSIGRKYVSSNAGIVAGILAAASPMLIEVDTSGMLEPLGFAAILLALLLYDKRTYWTGVLLAIASLTHVLFWFIAIAIVFSYLVFERSGTKFLPSILGWATLMIPYFWFMQTRTGDWLYALRWNILGNVEGRWISDITLPLEEQLAYRAIAIAALAGSTIAAIFLLRRKPRSYPLHAFFLSYVGLQSIIFGLTAYIVPYIVMGQLGRVLLDRLFAMIYYYGFLLAGFAIIRIHRRMTNWLLKQRLPISRIALGLILTAILVLVNVSSYNYVIGQYFAPTYRIPYDSQTEIADQIVSQYSGGTIVSSLVIVNYRLINRGISYNNVIGSLYIPTSNFTESTIWLRNHNVTWMILDDNTKPILDNAGFGPPFHRTQNPFIFYVNQTELSST
jgi:hypothetical protein